MKYQAIETINKTYHRYYELEADNEAEARKMILSDEVVPFQEDFVDSDTVDIDIEEA